VNNNYQIVKKETINAYSDCNSLSKESRQLDFLASRSVTVKEAEEIMSLAVEGGYNAFKPELISILPQDSKIWLARNSNSGPHHVYAHTAGDHNSDFVVPG
jgi:hypothetical protein